MLVLPRNYLRGLALLIKRPRLAQELVAREQRIKELKSNLARERRKIRQLKKPERRQIPTGSVHYGDLRRLRPISPNFGFDRGKPIDRYYIENFLAHWSGDIRGRVLEIGDNSYTQRYGGSRVKVSDVLNIAEGNPQTTIVADLTSAEHIPSDTFDCIILTQTLQFIYDVRSAIQTLHRILKPGGALLATFPGITQTSCREYGECYCWAFTQLSARRLFEETFPAASIGIEAHGNVLAVMAFVHGLAVEELRREELDYHDPDYELLITLRAVKPEAALSQGRRAVERLRRAILRPRSRSEGKALILLYHRVTELRSDPWSLAVSPERFAEHLDVIRQYALPLGLQQLVQRLLDGELPDRSVVVTFDDGYADNLHIAKPLLERYDIPATVFLTTGYIGHERGFWWDELDQLLLQPGTLPESIYLKINGSIYQRDLGEAAHYDEDTARRYRNWRGWQDAPTARHSMYISLWELLRPLAEGERRQVLDELLTWAGTESENRPTYRPLSLEEAINLAQGELVEVGAHTVTHPFLSTLSVASQRSEILDSKANLEEILDRPVTSFSYPYGSRSAETVAIVRKARFACACSTSAELVRPSTPRFRLPRVHVADWDREEFTRRLSRWFSD